MEHKKNRNLTLWVVILPVISVIVTALVLTKMFFDYEKENHTLEIQKSYESIIKQRKESAKDRVNEIVSFIKVNSNLLKQEAKDESKRMVDHAIDTIKETYEKNQNLPKEEILEIAFTKLRGFRFFSNLEGYVFIYGLDGTCLMHPKRPSLEGKNLIGIKDANGKQFIKDGINMLGLYGEGQYEWYWKKTKESKVEKKYGYLKEFKPLNIFVGTGRDESEVFGNIKREIQKLLISMRFGERGYIFAYDYAGNTISHIREDFIGVNRWDAKVEGSHLIRELIIGAQNVPEGFFMKYVARYDPVTKKEAYKTSFIQNLPEFGWVVGTGVYLVDVDEEIGRQKKVIEENLNNSLQEIALFSAMVLLFILLLSSFIFVRFKELLKNYQDNLIDQNLETNKQKEELVYSLEHDQLTSLPNRTLLIERLNQAIAHSKRDKRLLALMFIDIDNFKSINDSLGHDAGDSLLKVVAHRLESCIRDADTASRLGGDEFIVLLDDCKNSSSIVKVANKIQEVLAEPITLNGKVQNITISVGISLYPNDGENAKVLLKNADIAMYRAKDDGKNRYRFFTTSMNDEFMKQIEIEDDLRVAIKNREFSLYYQPIVEAKTGKIVGTEALIRWFHPEKGFIYPDAFIPIAEQSDLIVEIGEWVIDEACRQIVSWKKKGYGLERVSVNVAAKQLENPAIIGYIKKVLKQRDCKPEWLEVEVVERSVMKDIEGSIDMLKRLRELGIDVAIDDFGMDYSSLSYLKSLPITKLKIDRSFVKNIFKSYQDKAIAKTIIALGEGLEIDVLAEGVEDDAQKEFLADEGCGFMQGYLFSRPINADEVEEHLKRGEF